MPLAVATFLLLAGAKQSIFPGKCLMTQTTWWGSEGPPMLEYQISGWKNRSVNDSCMVECCAREDCHGTVIEVNDENPESVQCFLISCNQKNCITTASELNQLTERPQLTTSQTTTSLYENTTTPQYEDATASLNDNATTSQYEETTTSLYETTTTSQPEKTNTSLNENATTSQPENTTTSQYGDTTKLRYEDTTASPTENTNKSSYEDRTTSQYENTNTSRNEGTTTPRFEVTTTSLYENTSTSQHEDRDENSTEWRNGGNPTPKLVEGTENFNTTTQLHNTTTGSTGLTGQKETPSSANNASGHTISTMPQVIFITENPSLKSAPSKSESVHDGIMAFALRVIFWLTLVAVGSE